MASSLAVARIEAWFNEITEWIDIAGVDGELLFSHMKDLAEECNLLVRECRTARGMEMGTTLSMLMIVRNTYYIIQVGDSRVYRYNDGVLEQLTVDASVTRIKNGRMKSYLDNYLGKTGGTLVHKCSRKCGGKRSVCSVFRRILSPTVAGRFPRI